MIKELLRKYKFDLHSDRIGPDCLFTHWRLFFKPLMINLCKKKFKEFGVNAEFRPGAYAICSSKISIGENVIVRPNCMLFADPRIGEDRNQGTINIEKDAMLGSGVHIYVANHKYNNPNVNIIKQGHSESKSVILKEGCWIGANAVILPGVTIGKNSVVGAGSVVLKSIPDFCVAVGSPAKVIKKMRSTDDTNILS
jgi:acetyltransferase-like isoleucine patch superfamily enzyme